MISTETPGSGRQAVDAALVRADRRRRLARALANGLASLTGGLAVIAGVALLRLVLPLPAWLGWAAVSGTAGATLAVAGRRWFAAPAFDKAGAALDKAADLPDELGSAEWFLRQDTDSPWIDSLVARAADHASGLDVERLLPVAPPRDRLVRAGALAAVATLLLLVPTTWSRNLVAGAFGGGTADEGTLAALAPDEPEPELVPVPAEELLLPGSEPRPGAANTLDSFGGDPSDEGDQMDGEPGEGDPAGEAPEGAKGQTSGQQTRAANAGEKGGKKDDSASQDDEQGDQLSDELQQALDKAAEQASEQGASDKPTDQKQAGEGDKAAPQDSDQQGNDEGENQGQASKSDKQGEGKSANPGGSADRSGKGGDLSGAGRGEDDGDALGERTTLDVQLKREQLASALEQGESAEAEEREKNTERGAAGRGFQAVGPIGDRLPAGAQAGQSVPWAYQELVRAYFLERATRPDQKPEQKDR